MSGADNETETEEASSLAIRATEATVLSLIVCISVLGNVSLWIVVLRSKSLRTVTSMFILGLSGADLFVATVNMPLTVYSIVVGYWTFSSDACVIFGFFNMLSLVSSVLSLCNISINRYFMVVKPNRFKDIYTKRNAILMILAVFTVSICLSLPPVIGWAEYRYIPIQSFCFADWANHMSYAFFMIGCCFGIPFGVMTVCNILIFRTVQKSRRRVKMVVTNPSPRRSAEPQTQSESLEEKPKTDKDNQLTFTDVETFSISNSLKEELDLNESAVQHIQEFNESTDDPVFWEINDMYKSKTQNNNNNLSESDSSTQEDKPWSERTLLKVETSFLTNKDVRTVSTHWADAEMISKRSSEERPSSGESKTDSSRSNKSSVSPGLLHPHWKRRENRIEVTTVPKREKKVSNDIRTIIGTPENSVTSTASSTKNETKRRSRLPRSPSIRQREEVRLATTLAIIVIIFVICWLPYCVSMLFSIFYPDKVPRGFHMFTLLIGYANSGMNPIVYGLMNKRFKIGYQRLFCFCRDDSFTLSSDSPSH